MFDQESIPSVLDMPSPPEADACEPGTSYHLKIRVGVTEFEANGPISVVREDYRNFRDLLELIGDKLAHQRDEPDGTERISSAATQQETCTGGAFERLWERVYVTDDDKISLNIIPEGKSPNSDAILLLIYGYEQLKGLDGVPSVLLMESAKQSGLRIDRIDRNLTAEHSKLVLKGGSGKGTRYSLNNRGKRYSQELLEDIFE